ncbi:MAG: HAD family hydrolase [Gammaproteobacteria bacterium]|nr:HAD family hydrolase [Gammaproteobacteria bacterium]
MGENALTTWRALRAHWPQRIAGELPPDLRQTFTACRPAIETGFQNIALMWQLLDGATPEQILADFDALVAEMMEREGLGNRDLERMFGAARDEWLAQDYDGWLDAQGFYPGVVEAINHVSAASVIITTKQHRFALELVERAGIDIAPDCVFGLERLGQNGKRDILEGLIEANPGAPVHFFEDRLKTLERMVDLAGTRLYLAGWGYNTAAEREAGARMDAVQLLSLETFARLLK